MIGKGKLFGDLLAGAHTRTTDANAELERLATQLREDPGRRLDLRSFLAEYGHRETITPILVTTTTWGDEPATVMDMVRMLADHPPRESDVAGTAVRELEQTRPGWIVRRARRWIAAARAGWAFREDSHFYFTKPLPVLRRALLEIGGRLGIGEDVFHLRLEEIETIADSDADIERLHAIIRRRKAHREELAGVRLIDPALVFPQRDDGVALVSGTPASAGTATGPVKVIRSAAEFSRLGTGDILVCPYTNPSWTPLFQRAAAVVVDSGGIASHAAIVAREYGIPAIMGTAHGTTILAEGRVVIADGNTGRVLAAPAAAVEG